MTTPLGVGYFIQEAAPVSTRPAPDFATMLAQEESMGRRRGQHPTRKNPYIRCGSWLFRYDRYQYEDGVEKRRSGSTKLGPATGPDALTRKEALQEAVKFCAGLNATNISPGSSASVEQFVQQRYLPMAQSVFKKAGYEFKASILKQHIVPALGKKRLREVTPEHVMRLLQGKVAAGYSSQTVRHVRNIISGVFRFAEEMGYFTGRRPTDFRWRQPMRRVRQIRALTSEEVTALMNALPEYRLLITFLVVTGCRISEACGLRWGAVNLTQESVEWRGEDIPPGCVAILRAYVRSEYTTPKNATSRRLIPLPEALLEDLAEWRDSTAFSDKRSPVFASRTGKPIHPGNIAKRHLKPALKRLGLPEGVSWHWLRHTNSTMTNQIGMSAAERQKILGHADPKMTMRYSHADLEMARAGLESIAQKVRRKKGRVLVMPGKKGA